MRLVQLGNGALTTSRLGFGTSRLHYIGRNERQALLGTARDLGIVHFDTAPSYGDGLAETELGLMLKGRRDGIVIATKYGLPIDPLFAALPALATPLRAARSIARRAGVWSQQMPPLTANGLRSSVEASLRRLGTDRIDLLLLHEPSAQRMSTADALLAELIDLRARGLIRSFGLAGKWAGVRSALDAAPGIGEIVQAGESEWDATRTPDITYGALSGGDQTYWSAGQAGSNAGQRLSQALSRRPNGTVLVSTTKPDNLRALVSSEGV